MNRESVSSSNLKSIGYNPTSKILEVEFLHGGIYQYSNVPSTVYSELMAAASHGSYFSRNIRNDYDCAKLV